MASETRPARWLGNYPDLSDLAREYGDGSQEAALNDLLRKAALWDRLWESVSPAMSFDELGRAAFRVLHG